MGPGASPLRLLMILLSLRGLTAAEIASLLDYDPHTVRRSALWKVGQRSFQVENVLSAWEREITYTDERMRVT